MDENTSFPVDRSAEAFKAFWAHGRNAVLEPYRPRVDRYLSWANSGGNPVDPESLQGWLSHLAETGKSASYICGNYFALKAALAAWNEEKTRQLPRQESDLQTWALDKELSKIALPKVVKGKRAKMIREFQTETLDEVIRTASVRNSALIEFLADTGVRVSELAAIRLTDIRQFSPEWSYVDIDGKGKKERAIWVQNTLINRVRRVFHGRTWLFETKHGNPVNPDNVYKEIRRTFMASAGLALTPHNLRHYLATRLLRAGFSPRAVADFLGHSDPSTTSISYDVSTIPLEGLKTQHHGQRGRKSSREGKKDAVGR